MIKKLAHFFSWVAQRFLPDAYLFSVLLTFIVFLAGILVEGKSSADMLSFWGEGVWALLAFSMQMVLILVTGHTLANTRVMKEVLSRFASVPKTPKRAIMWVTFVSSIACWFNWGFGLIVGALLAKELVRKIPGIHYGLLIASAYSGFLVWHGGLSGSIPLQMAMSDGLLSKWTSGGAIPVGETIFAPMNLWISLILILTLPLINRRMVPHPEHVISVDASHFSSIEPPEKLPPNPTPANRLEHSFLVSLFFFTLMFGTLCLHFYRGGGLDLNIVILIFLSLGVLFHKTPIAFLHHAGDAVKTTTGIVIQYPIYAGIMGMMVHSGLAQTLSEIFIQYSNPSTFPFFVYLSAGIVNFFVPSGGGQWAVQGPIVIPAAQELGVPVAKAAMAIAWGDAWTNMLQPFFALPLLAIAGLGVRDIMGYCVVACIWSGIVTSLILFLF